MCRPVSAEDTGRPQRPGILPAAPTSAHREPNRDCHPSDGARALARQPCALSLPIDAGPANPCESLLTQSSGPARRRIILKASLSLVSEVRERGHGKDQDGIDHDCSPHCAAGWRDVQRRLHAPPVASFSWVPPADTCQPEQGTPLHGEGSEAASPLLCAQPVTSTAPALVQVLLAWPACLRSVNATQGLRGHHLPRRPFALAGSATSLASCWYPGLEAAVKPVPSCRGLAMSSQAPACLSSRSPSSGMAFAQQGPALDLGSYAQQGLQMRGGFGQPGPRSSQAARYLS